MPDESAQDSLDAQAALDAALDKLKNRPKKPRKPRAKKAVTAEAVDPPPVQADSRPVEKPHDPEVATLAPVGELAQLDTDEERAAIQAEAPISEEPAAELRGAKPRKSERRAWEINLRGDGQTWERVSTPDNQIVFRFKDAATDEQRELIQKYGFGYDAETKEASRPDDIAGRTYADKLSWFLKEAHRSRESARRA